MTFRVSRISHLASHVLNTPCVLRHVGASAKYLRAGSVPLIKILVCGACRVVHVSDKINEIMLTK